MNKYIRKIALFTIALVSLTLVGCANSVRGGGLNISFEPSEYLLQEGSNVKLEPIVKGGSLGTSTLEWLVTNPNIAKCEDGVVTGLNAGTTVIVATAPENPNIRASVKIVVEPTYYITYDVNGGVANDENPDKYYDSKCPYTLLDATRDGYTFAGWYDEDGQKVEKIEKGDKTDLVLTAKWTPITYSINYDVNSGDMVQSFDTYEDVVNAVLVDFNAYHEVNNTVEDYKNNNLDNLLTTDEANFFINNSDEWTWLLKYLSATSPNDDIEAVIGATSVSQIYNANPDAVPAVMRELRAFIAGNGNEYTADYSKEDVQNRYKEYDQVNEFTCEEEIELSTPAYKFGYKFLGWFDEEGNKVNKIEVGTLNNVNVKAEFEVINYALTLELNGGTLENAPTTWNIENRDLEQYVPTKEGYTFAGWYNNAILYGEAETEIHAYYEWDVEYYAKWEAIEYKLNYNVEGIDFPKQYETYEEVVDAFLEMYNNYFKTNYTAEEYSNSNTSFLDDEIDLIYDNYHSWKWLFEYFVTVSDRPLVINEFFNYTDFSDLYYKGGEISVEVIASELRGFIGKKQVTVLNRESADYSVEETLNGFIDFAPKYTYTCETEDFNLYSIRKFGYTFDGWYDVEGNQVTTITKGTIGDTNVSPKFIPIDYKLTFELNGGTLENAPTTWNIENRDLEQYVPTKDGYTFAGWYNNAILYGEAETEIHAYYEWDVEYYAKWTPITYSINYDVNGGDMVQSFDTYADVVEELVLAFNTYNEYDYSVEDFKNNNLTEMRMTDVASFFMKNGEAWDWLLQYFKTFSPNESLISLVEGANSMQDINQHNPDAIPAIKNEFIAFVSGTTILNDEGIAITGDYLDETVKNQCLEFDTPFEFTVLDSFDIYDAYKLGYKFLGWFDENGQKVRNIPTGTIGNICLTAEFEVINYALTLELNGGTLENAPTTWNIENRDLEQYVPTKEGYTFAGWYNNAALYGEAKSEIPTTCKWDTEYYAKWIAIEA